MTVVAAVEFDYFCSTGVRARQSNGAHRRFGARTDETQLFDRWNQPFDCFSELDLEHRGRSKGKAAGRSLLHHLHNLWVSVTQNQWSPGSDKVNISSTFGVEDIASLPTGDEKRRAANRFPSSHRAINAAGNFARGALKKFS